MREIVLVLTPDSHPILAHFLLHEACLYYNVGDAYKYLSQKYHVALRKRFSRPKSLALSGVETLRYTCTATNAVRRSVAQGDIF